MDNLQIEDEAQFRADLDELRSEDNQVDWILIEYSSKHKVRSAGKGEGGLDEFTKKLDSEKVQFGVLAFKAETGDSYNTTKNILITWIGADAPGGLAKARAAGHRIFLRDFIQESATVACELQASNVEELTHDMVGQAISRTRGGVYSSARTGKQTQAKSSSKGNSQFQFVDADAADAALKNVGGAKNKFAIFAYVKNQKGTAEFLEEGDGGIEELVNHWPPSDRVYFVYSSVVFQLDGNDFGMGEHNKFILTTLIGDSVSPIARARTAGQRQEFIDYIKTICPYHAEFQPNDKSDCKISEIKAKFS